MKKKVHADIFTESVLPTLRAKFKKIAALQKHIDDNYEIVETEEDGTETVITVKVAPAAAPAKKAPKVKTVAAGDDAAANDQDDQATADDADADPADGEGDDADEAGDGSQLEAAVAAGVTKALAALSGNKRRKPGVPAILTAKSVLTIPEAAKRFRPKNFKSIEGAEFNAGERAYRFAQFCYAAFGKSRKAAAFCEENGILIKRVEEGDDEIHQKDGANTFNNANGAILIPEDIDNDLIDLRETFGVARNLLRLSTMTRDTKTRHRRTGGLTAAFVGEGRTTTSSKKTWDAVQLVAKKLMVLALASNEFNDDVSGALSWADDTAGEIGYAFAEKEDDCVFNGTGTSTYGRIIGFLQKLVDVNGVDDGGGIVLASGNAWSEITNADFDKVLGRLPNYADGPGTGFVCHRNFYFTVMQRLIYAAGGVPGAEMVNGVRRNLFRGYPVLISQKMPSTEANSTIPVLFGDFAKAADFGDRKQTTISMSEHATVDGVNTFETDQVAIKGIERFDANVHDVGDATTAGPVVGLITAAS